MIGLSILVYSADPESATEDVVSMMEDVLATLEDYANDEGRFPERLERRSAHGHVLVTGLAPVRTIDSDGVSGAS